jgi:cation diffusion facilitator CzcD-associated flavoprotein CzcO
MDGPQRKLKADERSIHINRNDHIGGTWYENKYPGCACDVPAHTYTYTFEPNSEWSGFYSYSEEIQTYFERFYEKYKLAQYVQLNTEVKAATWDESKSECEFEQETCV